ncbi:MAG: Mur ligase family protein [Parcubacteria group bacterium]|jgi:UDP-N-acetylmuramoyl-tripeptide--D-alanyl-D-alanine ligase
MKTIFKPILKFYLKLIAKLVLAIHRPKIIAVAGSVNKTFVRDEIKKILEKKGRKVRANPRNFNTDIGLPLAILGLSSGYNSFQEWRPVISAAFRAIWQKNFPEYLVLELGVSCPGDMRYLLSIIEPEISVVTDITQRYLESFPTMNDLVAEYIILAEKTKKSGAVILNHDNLRVKELAKKSHAPVSYFGETSESKKDWKIGKIEKIEIGQIVEIEHDEKAEKITLSRFGRHHAFALVASLAVEELIGKK